MGYQPLPVQSHAGEVPDEPVYPIVFTGEHSESVVGVGGDDVPAHGAQDPLLGVDPVVGTVHLGEHRAFPVQEALNLLRIDAFDMHVPDECHSFFILLGGFQRPEAVFYRYLI